jgi:hypothetical protein
MVWCALAGNFPNSTALLSSEALEGDMLRIAWCGEYFIPETKLWNKVSGYFTTELFTRVCIKKTPN